MGDAVWEKQCAFMAVNDRKNADGLSPFRFFGYMGLL